MNEREISQGGDQRQNSISANLKLLQPKREAQVDLAINRNVTALALASGLMSVQPGRDFLLPERMSQSCQYRGNGVKLTRITSAISLAMSGLTTPVSPPQAVVASSIAAAICPTRATVHPASWHEPWGKIKHHENGSLKREKTDRTTEECCRTCHSSR